MIVLEEYFTLFVFHENLIVSIIELSEIFLL